METAEQARPRNRTPGPPSSPPWKRRTLLAGAGTVGALAATAALLPGFKAKRPAVPAPQAAAPESDGGYQLTDHVLRYYRTTRV